MPLSTSLDRIHYHVRENKWLRQFAIFLRIGLAWGFLTSGTVKILGERFTVLTIKHPMGHYLDAVYRTGFYYNFVGITQVIASILLLIPRTTTLGAFLYFPIILNIWMVSLSVRFEGSMVSSTLMVMANLYLILWDYHKWKMIMPFNHGAAQAIVPAATSNKFPKAFFGVASLAVIAVALIMLVGYDIKPRNTMKDCLTQCDDKKDPAACIQFCECIHKKGESLKKCLAEYEQVKNK
jgi:uncharacterized membrane protein YphA (DoxX/SURF4 family)